MLFKKKVNALDGSIVEKNEHIFYIKNIHPGNIVFDVGANIGELTLLFAKMTGEGGQIHAFEPTPHTFEKLSNIIKNAKKSNVVINNLAVSETVGFTDFNIFSEQYSAWNTTANRPLKNYGIDVKPIEKLQIPTTTIDDYCQSKLISQIDLLKIDVEGAELNVLRGAERMFAEKKIKICVFEFGQTIFDMGFSEKDLMAFFKKHQYKVKNISPEQHVYPIDKKTTWGCFSVLYAKPF